MSIQAKLDALPEFPTHEWTTSAAYYADKADCYAARLALAREWIAEANHHDGCECLYYVASSEMWFASDDKPCTCGRDALLKKLDGPK